MAPRATEAADGPPKRRAPKPRAFVLAEQLPTLLLPGVRRPGRSISYREPARNAGVSTTTVPLLQAGKAESQRRAIRKLAEALGVQPAELVGQ